MAEIEVDDDGGPFFRAYGLSVGHVLTEQDVADIQQVLADHNELIGEQADLYRRSRIDTLRELGGDALVDAGEAADDAMVKAACEKALARFHARSRELAACAESPAPRHDGGEEE